jgi:hypothetical protein
VLVGPRPWIPSSCIPDRDVAIVVIPIGILNHNRRKECCFRVSFFPIGKI